LTKIIKKNTNCPKIANNCENQQKIMKIGKIIKNDKIRNICHKMTKIRIKNGQKWSKKWSKNGQKRLKLATEKEKFVIDVTLAPVNLIAMRRSA
jgi:predicted NACHT family NTPase